jgi:hypothetical protein
LVKLQSQYRNQGLRIIGVTYPPEKLAEVRRFARKLQMNYRVAMGTRVHKMAFTNKDTLPITVVIDREEVVRDVIEGIMYSDEFVQRVRPLIKKDSSRRTVRGLRSSEATNQGHQTNNR